MWSGQDMNSNDCFEVKMLEDECWWGGCSSDGIVMPYNKDTDFNRVMSINSTNNQAVPFLVSNKGRYIWSENGFDFQIKDGIIKITNCCSIVHIKEGKNNLREAYIDASKTVFKKTSKIPPEVFFIAPQYNTWIELIFNQNQEGILKYAHGIIENNMPVGILMIDGGWAEYNGSFKFHAGRFPNPRGMIDELHDLGFKVMLWECPFISADTVEYRMLKQKGFLVKRDEYEPAIKQWWDGYSAVLDMTNPNAVAWLSKQNEILMEKYGVDGFKFDAGDAIYYSKEDITYQSVSPNEQSELWAKFGLNYEFNEYRACFKCSGQPLVQRLADKLHTWDDMGLSSLIPNILALGILGYAYTCPDMIGGGEYSNFMLNSDKLDSELVVRYAQCSSLMPMMQFSAAPWRILDQYHFEICKESALLHCEFAKVIVDLALDAANTFEPIVRYMEYVFPHQNMEYIKDQFMLGNKIMVAPVITKGAMSRTVVFPGGLWKDSKDNIFEGGCTKEIESPIDNLLYFEKID